MPAARSPRSAPSPNATLTIGKVIAALEADFPDLTVSKIRFLETEGLLTPERTASGYRKYSEADVERLRYILTAQRDHFWPLKIIGEALAARDAGSQGAPPDPPPRAVRLTAGELAAEVGASEELVEQLVAGGLVAPDAAGRFGAGDLHILEAVVALRAYGLETRHLRPFKATADREVGLVEQMLAPSPRGVGRDRQVLAREIARHLLSIHGALLHKGLGELR